jgi:hypothetical protein
MPYLTSNPPALLVQRIGGGRAVWLYSSSDAKAVVDTSGYFSDGHALGMRDGDLLLAYDTGTKIWSSHTVLNVSGTTIDAGNGTDIGVSANAD